MTLTETLPAAPARNAAATRQAILTAARRRFLAESYDTVGLRDVAGDVGVDVSLIGRYFGGKAQLFRDALCEGEDTDLFAGIGDASEIPDFLAGLSFQSVEERKGLEALIIILRSASSPTAAGIVRESFHEDLLAPIARLLDGPDGELRASLSLAVLIGATVIGTIMSVGPLSEAEAEPIRRRIVRLIEAALAPD